MDNYGVSFAPTQDNASQGPLRGQIDGIPAALKILALRLPRFAGTNMTNPVAPEALATGGGAQGIDPITSLMIRSMLSAAGSHAMGAPPLPGGTAGPNLSIFSAPPLSPSAPPSVPDYKPHVVFQENGNDMPLLSRRPPERVAPMPPRRVPSY